MTIAAAAAAIWVTADDRRAGNRACARRSSSSSIAAMVVPGRGRADCRSLGAQMQGGALDAVHEVCRVDRARRRDRGRARTHCLGAELPAADAGVLWRSRGRHQAASNDPARHVRRAWKDDGPPALRRHRRAEHAARAAAPNAIEVAHVVIADAPEPERTLGPPARRLRTEAGRDLALPHRPGLIETTIGGWSPEAQAAADPDPRPRRRPPARRLDHPARSTTRPSTSMQEVDRVRAAMDASAYSYEIIVVDDGSTDNSAEVASPHRGDPLHPLPPEPRIGLGPQGGHARRRGAGSPSGPTST